MSKEEPLVVSDDQIIRLLKDANKKLGDHARMVTEHFAAAERKHNELTQTAERAMEAWDSTVLPTPSDGMMQERMECLRAALAIQPNGIPQNKSALYKSLGLVPWDGKPPACTDTVWIEPGRASINQEAE